MDLRQGLAASAANPMDSTANPMDSSGLDEFRKLLINMIANRILENLNIMAPSAKRRVTIVPDEPNIQPGPFPELQEIEISETPESYPLPKAFAMEATLPDSMQNYWNSFDNSLVNAVGPDPLQAVKTQMLGRNPNIELAGRQQSALPTEKDLIGWTQFNPRITGSSLFTNSVQAPNVGVQGKSRKVLKDSFGRPVSTKASGIVETTQF
ncbi:MAG: hypothetical protein ACK52I_08360 [Pseudomonadota bacterium]|jgi:hypothetical protein